MQTLFYLNLREQIDGDNSHILPLCRLRRRSGRLNNSYALRQGD